MWAVLIHIDIFHRIRCMILRRRVRRSVSSFDKACKGKEEEDEGESLSIVMAVESDDREPDFLLFRKDIVSLLCKAEAGGLKTLTLNRALTPRPNPFTIG